MSPRDEIRPTTYEEWSALEEERDQLRAELSSLRSAPVAVEVPGLSFWKHSNGKWFCWDGYTNVEMTPSRILKDGEIAATSTELAQMLTTANNCSCEGGGVWREDEATDLLRSLRSGEVEKVVIE